MSSIDVNQNNPAEVTLVQSLPDAKLVTTPENQVSVSNISGADPLANKVATDLAAQLEGFNVTAAEANLLQDNLNALENAAKRIDYNIGTLQDKTLSLRSWGQALGFRFDPDIGEQELINSINVRLALSLIAMTKGPISDSEMKLFIRGMPGLGTSPEGFRLQIAYMRRMANYQQKFYEDFLADDELQAIIEADRSEYNIFQKNNAVNQWKRNWRANNALPFDRGDWTQMAAGGNSPFANSEWNDLSEAEKSKRLSVADSLYNEARNKLNTGAGSGNRTVRGPRRGD
jgi:hypothetical protein